MGSRLPGLGRFSEGEVASGRSGFTSDGANSGLLRRRSLRRPLTAPPGRSWRSPVDGEEGASAPDLRQGLSPLAITAARPRGPGREEPGPLPPISTARGNFPMELGGYAEFSRRQIN